MGGRKSLRHEKKVQKIDGCVDNLAQIGKVPSWRYSNFIPVDISPGDALCKRRDRSAEVNIVVLSLMPTAIICVNVSSCLIFFSSTKRRNLFLEIRGRPLSSSNFEETRAEAAKEAARLNERMAAKSTPSTRERT